MRVSGWNTGLLASLAVSAAACDSKPGCVSSFKELGSAQDVCLRTDTSSTSTVTADQAAACYDQPQICPSLQPINFCSRLVGAEPAAFNLLLQNPGSQPLTISRVRVRGDTRCAFQAPQLAPELGQPVPPGDGLIFRFKYLPPEAGEDHIQFEFDSDAENFPTLVVAVCARGVTSTTGEGALRCIPCEDRSGAEFTDCWAR